MENILLPIAVHVFLIRENSILLAKRINTGFKDGYWSVPAGRLNSNETIRQAMVREVKEEVGVKINVKDLSKPILMHHQDDRGERLHFFSYCSVWKGKLKNMETDKCEKIEWFNFDGLPDQVVEHVKFVLENLNKSYFEYGFENKFLKL